MYEHKSHITHNRKEMGESCDEGGPCPSHKIPQDTKIKLKYLEQNLFIRQYTILQERFRNVTYLHQYRSGILVLVYFLVDFLRIWLQLRKEGKKKEKKSI